MSFGYNSYHFEHEKSFCKNLTFLFKAYTIFQSPTYIENYRMHTTQVCTVSMCILIQRSL